MMERLDLENQDVSGDSDDSEGDENGDDEEKVTTKENGDEN